MYYIINCFTLVFNGFELLNHFSSKQASKQMVLNYQTIFKANNGCECSKPIFQILVYYIINCFTLVFNGFELLNHFSSKQASKKMVLNYQTILKASNDFKL